MTHSTWCTLVSLHGDCYFTWNLKREWELIGKVEERHSGQREELESEHRGGACVESWRETKFSEAGFQV